MNTKLNRNQLKYIAVIAMLIDHIAMFFVPITTPLGMMMRIIGRLTAPIMSYFIAEGFFYTKSKAKYGIRLFVFAVVSQLAYAFSHSFNLFTLDFNVIFTFFICFLVLLSYENIKNSLLRFLAVTALVVLSFPCDWGVIAPMWVLMFWIFRDDMKKKITGFALVALLMIVSGVSFSLSNGYSWCSEIWQAGMLLFIPLLILYSGEKGNDSPINKWFFYIFYPVHLIVLGLIKLWIG